MKSDYLYLDLDILQPLDLDIRLDLDMDLDTDLDTDLDMDLDTDLDMDLDILRSTWTQFRTKNGYCARILYAVRA